MKTYRNVKTGDKAELVETRGYWVHGIFTLFPVEYIEDSKDWVEIVSETPVIPELFVTEDGVSIKPGDTWWYVVLEKMDKPRKTTDLKGKPIMNPTVKRFSTEELAWSYINEIRTKVMIKTKDYVHMFFGQRIWYVFPGLQYTNFVIPYNFEPCENLTYFSTERGAIEYIDNNKPRYSKSDIQLATIKNLDLGFDNVLPINIEKLKDYK